MAPETNEGESRAEQLRRRNRELAILATFAEALNRSVILEQALQTALAQAAALLDLQTGWIWLLREDTGESYLAAAQNLPPALRDNPQHMEGWCYCLDTYRRGDLDGAANVNVITCSRLKNLVRGGGTDGLRYHASIPLYALDPGPAATTLTAPGRPRAATRQGKATRPMAGGERRKLGVLNVASTDWRELSADDLRILHTVGDLLSMAVERARLYARGAEMGAVEERNRLAREIHDTLAQGLTAITLRLETADALLEAGSEAEQVRQAVRDALSLARTGLEEARRSVLDLRAAPLEGQTLAEALEDLAGLWAAQSGLPVRFEAVGGGRPLPVRVEAGVYRIVEEALRNAVQHAQARHVMVRFVTTPEEIRCTVEDDGRGFDPEQVAGAHYGLVGLNERARLLGGRLRLESSPGEGTRVELVLPLEPG